MKRRTLTGGERADWLRLSRTRGIGPITFFHLLERYGSAAAVLEDLPALAKKAGGKSEIRAADPADIQREIDATAKLGAAHLAACEPDYSGCLAAIDAPPPVIAIRGNRNLLNRPSIAMVGARDASAAGRRMARDLARDLGQAGYVIVSGMARGVDGEAHGAAMETGTVAAIAGGIDQIYPPQHEQLYGILAQRGCLVSESPFGYVAQARDFPKRNRVISGLSLATIVVEAADRSGSLITARFALEQGREVMAVPGSPLDPRARGANRLLKQGAALIESAEDVLHEMEGIAPPTFDEPFADRFDARDADVPPALLRAVREALSPTPMRIEEIVRAVDAPHRLVLAALAELELAGHAQTHVGGTASRAV
ncbi:MAG TPA: DNA-processing protein DprA [Hyphomonadaceae bacterium]|nr:DNA-processing protein DprA [Hyphomonadaceae bacterium]HPI47893.1 DNA-processing protein DprA [Hyphomonadaceae bacterium]